MICTLNGKPSENKDPDPLWVGWNGKWADPRSPAGGGGPGHFSRPGPHGISSSLLAQMSDTNLKQQQDLTAVPLQSTPITRTLNKNPPPITKPTRVEKIKFVRNTLVDVEIGVEVVEDGHSSDPKVAASTNWQLPSFEIPGVKFDDSKKITSFTGKFVWKGVIRIQTIYGPDVNASSLSGYGRGTTKADISNGDITLGFHENCHQSDFLDYLIKNQLPNPPNLSIGMEKASFDKECKSFKSQFEDYRQKMELNSKNNTDEVGYTLTEFKKSNKPYQHSLP